MIFRHRLRLVFTALAAIILTFLMGVETFGDEVIRIVKVSRNAKLHETFLNEMASLDAEFIPEQDVKSSRVFKSEEPKSLGYNYTRTVVLGKQSWEDVSWVESELSHTQH